MTHLKFPFEVILSILLFFVISMSTSCSEEDPIVFPELIESNNTTFNVGVADSIEIQFTERFAGFDSTHYIETKAYYPSLKSISINDIEIFYKIEEEIKMVIWPEQLFPSNAGLILTFEIEWYDENKVFQESILYEYDITVENSGFPIDQIRATYPVDRQLNFLQNETEFGFLLFSRLPTDISNLGIKWNDKDGKLVHTSVLTKKESLNRIDFDIPNLENETIYAVEIEVDGTSLKSINLRTSKYNTFKEKISNLSLIDNAELVRHEFKNGPDLSLIQSSSLIGEGFDAAEASHDSIKFEETDKYYHYYSSGLIQLAFNSDQNKWFNEYVHPLIYAPFDDFTYDFIRPDILGDSCFYAMKLEFQNALPSLTNSEIANKSANPAFEENFNIGNFSPFAIYFEYHELQYRIANKYLQDTSIPRSARVNLIIAENLRAPEEGTYKFDLNYRLPDGTVTYSETHEMLYDLGDF